MVLDFIAIEVELYERLVAWVEEKHELSSMELAILLFLANNPDRDTATDIVNIRRLSKSHVSTTLRMLEEKGLLRKAYLNGDHRTVHLSLTNQSDEIVADGRMAQSEFYSVLRKGFSEAEIQTMNSYFERMNNNVNAALREGK